MTSRTRALFLIASTVTSLYAQKASVSIQDKNSVAVTITEPGFQSIETYAKQADIIALVRVVAGDSEAYKVPIYKAVVVNGFKGALEGQTIYFGRFIGTRLGWEYVLFLRSVKEPISPKTSPDEAFGTVRYSNVFSEGYSSLETSYECVFEGNAADTCDYAVRVCTDYFGLPSNFPVFPPMRETTAFGCRWTRKTSFLSLLGNITVVK